jgi:hypothetical protein
VGSCGGGLLRPPGGRVLPAGDHRRASRAALSDPSRRSSANHPFRPEHGDGVATRHGTSPWLKDMLEEREEK